MVRETWYILVPEIYQRAVFWFHLIKGAGNCCFRMTGTLFDCLKTCAYTTKKQDTKLKPYRKKKSIVAQRPMHIFCIDLYGYNDEKYLAGFDVFSKIPYGDYVASKEATTVVKKGMICAL